MKRTLRAGALAAALAALSPYCSAYYYWTYFAAGTAPFAPVPVRFDLNGANPYGLQNNTAVYVISQQGPAAMMPGDSFPAIVNEIRAAARVWNTVGTSSLRLQFGGLSPMTTPENSAGIDVVFDQDTPPGLLAMTVVTTVSNPAQALANGAGFLPIVHSTIHLVSDLTANQQSSYSDSFFVTLVHEFGHALGLQHTETSSVMSTQVTSAATKAAPLAADDIAGVSLLYPANGYPSGTGTISGTVSIGPSGINLASVVALSANGTAVSALTNPDGSYTINGVPPGQYYVYAHPLPPPAQGEAYPDNVVPPLDASGNAYPAFTQFGTLFWAPSTPSGGTTDWTQAQQLTIASGSTASGINFNVPPRPGGPAVSGMTVYGYPGNGQVAVGPAPIQTYGNLAFKGNGLVVNGNQVAPGLTLSVIGGAAYLYNPITLATGNVAPLYDAGSFLYVSVNPQPVSAPTPVAIAAQLNGDVYVLPSAFRVVTAGPPSITGVSGSTDASGNATVRITGSGLSSAQILFDNLPAISTSVNADGSITAVAPPAPNGYQASVEALAGDSQTSWELNPASAIPPRFTYAGPIGPSISLNLPGSTVAAGTDTMVQISGYNTNFIDGQVSVGFGSSDIVVKQLWVVSPGEILVDISVNANAVAQAAQVTVQSGLEQITAPGALPITAAVPGEQTLRAPIVNLATGLAGTPAGGTAIIGTSGLPPNLNGFVVTIANQVTPFTVGPNNQLQAVVPGGALSGPALVRLYTPAGLSLPPVVMQIDIPPPVIEQAANTAGVAADATHPIAAGSIVSLTVFGLADQDGVLPAASSVIVNIGGVNTPAMAVTATSPNTALVQFLVPPGLTPGPESVAVQVGTRVSAASTVAIAGN